MEIMNALGYSHVPQANRSIPITILKEAVYNPITPAPVILIACNHPNKTVRKAAAKHPNCPEEGRVIVGLRS
jgi:hypothetical protein